MFYEKRISDWRCVSKGTDQFREPVKSPPLQTLKGWPENLS